MQGKKHYTEKLFTSFQLSTHVPEDNFYRRLQETLDLQWVYKATKKYYGTEGQRSIDPVVFFKLILIGYLENLASDRRILNTVSMRMDMLYFLGYDLDDKLPWHSTLSRTRQLYGLSVFKELFKSILNQCIEKGMVAGRRQAIDSVQVIANASMDSLVRKAVLDDGDAYADNLKEEDSSVLTIITPHMEVVCADNLKAEDGKEPEDDGPAGNDTHSSTTDPDARLARKPGKPTDLKYLSQVSVDTAHHVITAVQAHHADKRDSECLSKTLQGAIENLESQGLIVEEIIADTNYSSGTALQYLEDNNIRGYIPNHGGYKVERPGFTYDKEMDCYVCSQGIQLQHTRTYLENTGYMKIEYRSSAKDCKGCPLRAECIGKGSIKRITHNIDKPLYERMHERMQTRYAKRMMKLRQSTVEPVLGTLVNFLGMRRVNTRGIMQAEKCMVMAAIAYNLKKLLKFSSSRVKVIAKNIEKSKGKVQQSLFFILESIRRDDNRNMQIIFLYPR